MIRFVRTASIEPGKFGDAIAWAGQISEFMKRQHRLQLEVMLPVGGNPHRIAWRAEYESLAALDALQAKVLASRPRVFGTVGRGGEQLYCRFAERRHLANDLALAFGRAVNLAGAPDRIVLYANQRLAALVTVDWSWPHVES